MQLPPNKELGPVFNNDGDNILCGMDAQSTMETYLRALNVILDARPGVFAQCVGTPDAVMYATEVATTQDKHLLEVDRLVWPESDAECARSLVDSVHRLRDAGTDVLSLTIDACRERGVAVLADYRMNAEDWYAKSYLLSDFGRTHPEWRLPLSEEEKRGIKERGVDPAPEWAGCLDPAVPEVFEYRLDIFREVAERYDIDGIEFDFRRWCHMVSGPLENYPILTRLVRETRQVLDDVARAKGRERLLLGARVGPSLDDPAGTEYPGGKVNSDMSCRLLGLDVRKWIDEELVDYVSPALFWPRWPGLPKTAEFAALARDRNVGVYPTLFPLPAWLAEEGEWKGPINPDDTAKIKRYRDGFCDLALQLYEDGADGVSTFNWYFHLHLAQVPRQWQHYYGYGMGGSSVQKRLLSIMSDPARIRQYRSETIG